MSNKILLLSAICLLGLTSCGGGNPKPSGTFTITWKNYDGTILETDKDVKAGETPQFDGTIPSIDGKGLYTATFSGWEPAITQVTADATYTAKFDWQKSKSSLEAYTWPEISTMSADKVASKLFKIGDTKKVQLKHQTGNISQTVRVVGFDQDVDPKGNSLGFTFEFADLISDANGYSIASIWQDTATISGSCYDFLNSSLRKNLTGEGTGKAGWFEKDGDEYSTTYANKTVLSMLPDDLNKALKIVKKKVNRNTTGKWELAEFTDKLFLPASLELGYSSSSVEEGLTTYSYYSGHTSMTDPIRIKKQIKGNDGARTTWVPIHGIEATSGSNYAGFNESASNGGRTWIRSPKVDSLIKQYAYGVDYDGTVGTENAYNNAHAIAPFFAI